MTTKPFWIAVDVGKNGGIAWVENGAVRACKMPDGDLALLTLLQTLIINRRDCEGRLIRAAIELVGGYVKPPRIVRNANLEDGSKPDEFKLEGGQPGSAMFKFGESAGLVRGMLLALGAEVELIPPKAWQAPLFIRKGKMEKASWKRALWDAAQRKFPNLRVTLNTADALLILAYKCPELASGGLTSPAGQTSGIRQRSAKPAANSSAPKPAADTTRRIPDGAALYVGIWKDENWTFRALSTGRFSLVRRATIDDLRTLPALALPK